MPGLLPLLLLAFVVANGIAWLDWSVRRDDERAAVETRRAAIARARYAARNLPALIAYYEGAADALERKGLMILAAHERAQAAGHARRLAYALQTLEG